MNVLWWVNVSNHCKQTITIHFIWIFHRPIYFEWTPIGHRFSRWIDHFGCNISIFRGKNFDAFGSDCCIAIVCPILVYFSFVMDSSGKQRNRKKKQVFINCLILNIPIVGDKPDFFLLLPNLFFNCAVRIGHGQWSLCICIGYGQWSLVAFRFVWIFNLKNYEKLEFLLPQSLPMSNVDAFFYF